MNNQTNENLKPLDEQPSGENETKPEASASSEELSEPSRFFEEAAGKDGKNVPAEDPFFSPLPDIDIPDDDAAEAETEIATEAGAVVTHSTYPDTTRRDPLDGGPGDYRNNVGLIIALVLLFVS